ncbi:hypothetical protein AZI86_08895 [Bdellovibrio bacteriovorus]|uniref:Uncharacterized protein n=1 Tax=Bdellovibrio bacteriovorus TaxID=959 RepID=A0A150WS15_BDEBC|nr:hypothetical protein [Bdellovibrio bacteriovorus]KYG67117.1 hypothetical protein AZI86_08895 [Bdellovibrio bacteriovorus]
MFKFQITENKMIAMTALLVVAMAFPTYQTLAQNDEVKKEEVAVVTLDSDRKPASIASPGLKDHKPRAQFQTVDLKCTKKMFSPLSIAGGYVQFQGKNCLNNFKEGDVEIINKSNGFTASIFLRGSDKYQTDLIQLQQGDNEIAIRYRESSGKSVEEIIRIHASSI